MNDQDKTFGEDLKKILEALPIPIREYLRREGYVPVVKQLTLKYGLRIDQSGVLARDVIFLIMGIEDPNEFVKSLQEVAISEDSAKRILADINQEIFVPLREEMRKQSQGSAPAPAASQQTRPVVPSATTYSRPASPSLTPPPPQTPRPSLASVPSLIPQVKKPSINILRKEPVTPPQQPTPVRPALPQQPVRPQIAAPAPVASRPQAPTPPQMTLSGAVSQALLSRPPVNAIQHPPLVPPPARETPPPPVSTPKPSAPVPPAKSYGTDPYREPIE